MRAIAAFLTAMLGFFVEPVVVSAQSNTGAGALEALCTRGVASLRESLKHEPQALAARAASGGDLRYLEWFGFYSAIPGVANQQCVREGKFFKWFEGTSDVLCSEEHRVLYERSHAFAERYNRAMASLRTAKGLESCNVR
jgi:hypothetical protein